MVDIVVRSSWRDDSAGRPRFDIAHIVRQYRAALEVETYLSLAQQRVLSDIVRCRSAARSVGR